jgi:hypothetical protein
LHGLTIRARLSAPNQVGTSGNRLSIFRDMAGLTPMLRIATTGHRDLDREELEYAERQSKEALDALLGLCEGRRRWMGALPFRRDGRNLPGSVGYRLLSALAPGSDRIFAGLVAAPDSNLRNRRRELVVPFSHQDEHRDGEMHGGGANPVARNARPELYGLPEVVRPTWIPLALDRSEDPYVKVASYLVDNCDVLFAFWDGRSVAGPEGRGGTSFVVAEALARRLPVIWIPVLRNEPKGELQFSVEADQDERTVEVLLPNGEDPPTRVLLFSVQVTGASLNDGWNTPVRNRAASRPTEKPGHRTDALLPLPLERFGELALLQRFSEQPHVQAAMRESEEAEETTTREMDDDRSGNRKRALEALATWGIGRNLTLVDETASSYQRKLRGWSRFVFALAVVAVVVAALEGIVLPKGGGFRYVIIAEIAALVGLLVVLLLDLRRRYYERWVSMRALAEYLRIASFVYLVEPTVTSAKSPFEFDQLSQLIEPWETNVVASPWFAPVVGDIWEDRPRLALGDADVKWLKEHLRATWVVPQLQYHWRKKEMHARMERWLGRAVKAAFLLTLVVVATHLGLIVGGTEADRVGDVLTVCAIALASIGAAFNGYAAQEQHYRHRDRSAGIAAKLVIVNRHLTQAATMEGLRHVAAELEQVTLGEATDWYQAMRNRPLPDP